MIISVSSVHCSLREPNLQPANGPQSRTEPVCAHCGARKNNFRYNKTRVLIQPMNIMTSGTTEAFEFGIYVRATTLALLIYCKII